MSRMSFDPMPFNVLLCGRGIQQLPQILILDGGPRRRAPAARLPVRQPLGDALKDVFRIGIELDRAAPLERTQAADCRHQLHAVVGGRGFGARDLFALLAGHQQGSPAARARIAAAGAVGEYFDLRHRSAPVIGRLWTWAPPRPPALAAARAAAAAPGSWFSPACAP